MKQALVYDPYLDTLGGGERYTLTFAQILSQLGYNTEIAWKNKADLENAANRFGLDLSALSLNSAAFDIFSSKTSLIKKFSFTRKYHLIFYLSDGSLPFLFAQKNYLHFQVPFTKLGGSKITNRLKSTLINKFIYNSNFTRRVIEKQLPSTKGTVLYPPIDVDNFQPTAKKQNLILSVARFDSPSHHKRQDILIKAFKKLNSKAKSQYKLILAGGLKGNKKILDQLKTQAQGLPLEFVINPSFPKLKHLYSISEIFWHAAGYQIDEQEHPEQVEHFGITTVEAMAAGCVPVVINKGGQKEIITTQTGFLCDSIDSLANKTQQLIKNPFLLKKYSASAVNRAKTFSQSRFAQQLKLLLNNEPAS